MMEQILKQLISELHATGDDHCEIAKHCGMSPRAFSNFINGRLKNGGSIKSIIHDESDLDLVILASEDVIKALVEEICEESQGTDYPRNCATVRIGKLNLIAVGVDQYDIWKQGTDELKLIAPVTRDHAVSHFKKLREQASKSIGEQVDSLLLGVD